MFSRIAGIETIYYMIGLSFMVMCLGCIPACMQRGDLLNVQEEQRQIEQKHQQQLIREHKQLTLEDVGRLT